MTDDSKRQAQTLANNGARSIAEMLEVFAERGQQKQSEPAQGEPTAPSEQQTATVVQLPLWPDAVRAVPNGILRSALFGAIGRGRRRYIKGEELAAIDGVTIRYKGERLDQGDLDVWQCVLHAVRAQAMGSRCRLTGYMLLKVLGKTDTGKNRATLQARLERLVANAVTIKQGRYTYIGSLVTFAAKDENTQEWVVEIDPRMRPLFEADQFTQLEWDVRHALDGQQLAQWLYGFYASHANPFPIRVETLHQLCGSEASLMSDFAKKLRKALEAIQAACQARGEAFSYEVADGLVTVKKHGSGAQRRHLSKQAKAAAKASPKK